VEPGGGNARADGDSELFTFASKRQLPLAEGVEISFAGADSKPK
jgi:hypothetical protein